MLCWTWGMEFRLDEIGDGEVEEGAFQTVLTLQV